MSTVAMRPLSRRRKVASWWSVGRAGLHRFGDERELVLAVVDLDVHLGVEGRADAVVVDGEQEPCGVLGREAGSSQAFVHPLVVGERRVGSRGPGREHSHHVGVALQRGEEGERAPVDGLGPVGVVEAAEVDSRKDAGR